MCEVLWQRRLGNYKHHCVTLTNYISEITEKLGDGNSMFFLERFRRTTRCRFVLLKIIVCVWTKLEHAVLWLKKRKNLSTKVVSSRLSKRMEDIFWLDSVFLKYSSQIQSPFDCFHLCNTPADITKCKKNDFHGEIVGNLIGKLHQSTQQRRDFDWSVYFVGVRNTLASLFTERRICS